MITPREIQKWWPEHWSEIVGNVSVVRALLNFITYGGANMLITGPSRSGKTRSISLGIMAVMCPNRTAQLEPCGQCTTCREIRNGRENVNGLFSLMADANANYFIVDCETVEHESLLKLSRDAAMEFGTTIVYLDEVAALGKRGLDSLLLKAIDETPATWVASSIAVRKADGSPKRTPGLTNPMLNRFAVNVATTLPPDSLLIPWIRERCTAWDIALDDNEQTLPILIKRCRRRVGLLVKAMAAAAMQGRLLDFKFASTYEFQALD